MNSQLTTTDRNSLFEVTTGLSTMVVYSEINQVEPILPIITKVGSLLFLASLFIQAFNYVFLSKLLNFDIVTSTFKFGVEETNRYSSQNSL